MQVTFTRTGARRYNVLVEREHGPRVTVDPAPGYDDHLPHDLVHFVVEVQCALRDGIYGQLAAGGNAGLFRPVDEHHTKQWARKYRRKDELSGQDIPRSEHLASIGLVEWYARSGRAKPRAEHQELIDSADLSPGGLDALVARLDHVSVRWRELDVGEAMTLDWPWPERRTGRRRTSA